MSMKQREYAMTLRLPWPVVRELRRAAAAEYKTVTAWIRDRITKELTPPHE